MSVLHEDGWDEKRLASCRSEDTRVYRGEPRLAVLPGWTRFSKNALKGCGASGYPLFVAFPPQKWSLRLVAVRSTSSGWLAAISWRRFQTHRQQARLCRKSARVSTRM